LAPAVVVAASTTPPALRLTLAPAFALVQPDQHEVTFILVNSGDQAVHIAVTSSDSWVVPSEQGFDLAGNTRHDMVASVSIPTAHDAGDHETRVTFSVPPTNTSGLLAVTQALASRVIVAVGGIVIRDLHIYGLTTPRIADSFESPPITLTLDNSRSNVYEIVTVAPFGQVLLLRGQVRTLSLAWGSHPWFGPSTVNAGGMSSTTWFIPWHVALGLLGLLCGIALSLSIRHSRPKEVTS